MPKAIKVEQPITYKGKPIKITADFSAQNLKDRFWGSFSSLKENSCQSTLLYSVTLTFQVHRKVKTF